MRLFLTFLIIFNFILLFSETEPIEPENFNDINAGSLENPFLITNLSNLRWLAETPEVWSDEETQFYFEQTADIDASDSQTWNDGTGFSPIGLRFLTSENDTLWIEEPFCGNYEGNKHLIGNLYMNRSTTQLSTQGMFGFTEFATISNLQLVNVDFSSTNFIGILVGFAMNTTISGCATYGIISGEMVVAGIAGLLSNSSISKCLSYATITGDEHCAGIAGDLLNSEINNSYFAGHLEAGQYSSASIAGVMVGTSTISFCYAANTQASAVPSGLVNTIMDTTYVSNCFFRI